VSIPDVALSFYRKVLGGLHSGVRLDKSHPCRRAIPELQPLLGQHLHPISLRRELLLEIRSLFGRIGEALKTKLYYRGVVGLHPRLSSFLSLEESLKATTNCTEDMLGILVYRPWMSTSDVLSFSLAWTLGYESCIRNHYTKSSLSEQSSASQPLFSEAVAIPETSRNDVCTREKL